MILEKAGGMIALLIMKFKKNKKNILFFS